MSSIIPGQNGTAGARPSSALLYPALLIAGIAVIIASVLGTAAMIGLLPLAKSQSVAHSADERASRSKAAVDSSAKNAGSKTATPAPAPCKDCGVIDSVPAVDIKGQGSGIGVVAGNEVEKNMKKKLSYEIRVRMDDNRYRNFQSTQSVAGAG